jgi:hypothetical protein
MTEEDKDELCNTELFFTYDILAQDDSNQLYWHAVCGHVQTLQLANYLRDATKDWPEVTEEED